MNPCFLRLLDAAYRHVWTLDIHSDPSKYTDLCNAVWECRDYVLRDAKLRREAAERRAGEPKRAGRSRTLDREKILSLAAVGVPKVEIARQMGIERTSVFRVLREQRNNAGA